MRILNIYKSQPDDIVKQLVAIVTRDREEDQFYLNSDNPNYDELVEKIFTADQTICWW